MALKQRRGTRPDDAAVSEEQETGGCEESTSISVLDILRMVLGILLLNMMVSWWMTGSLTYGYKGKLLQRHFWYYQLFGSRVSITEDELLQFNGSDASKPLYIAINGTVWDVSSNPRSFGAGGSYGSFAGKDVARALATNCLNHLTHDIRDIKSDELRRLRGWIEWFDDKYFRVGEVIHGQLNGIPPSREHCAGRSR
ncbi:unnamed protein product [Cyberlindnera jadinii]|uniref:Cytochrome b5 heme-binding domain-containing protein n=1 Tax=Cyberlindnera jadinii (strain ATCC 18201 / CBS 1600 / BCRC 20928 / JCM 3617 / NBRC 0987 / NRRL Y-1542) TaxID=983966 RepID=A0A0H5C4U8_CYBJN|nr:unnamed protein product [Cyberlindnera jadinii]